MRLLDPVRIVDSEGGTIVENIIRLLFPAQDVYLEPGWYTMIKLEGYGQFGNLNPNQLEIIGG